MAIEIKLPELGDGIESGDVLDVLVSEGDVIEKDQAICELETDKATLEVPSSHAGKIIKIHIASGQTVPIGATLLTLEGVASPQSSKSSGPESAPAEQPAPQTPPQPASEAAPPPASDNTESSSGNAVAPPPAPEPTAPPVPTTAAPSTPSTSPSSRDGAAGQPQPNQQPSSASAAAGTSPTQPAATSPAKPPSAAPETAGSKSRTEAAAGPAIRRLAREVGIDLSQLTGTGVSGRITREDVLAAVRRGSATVTPPAPNPNQAQVHEGDSTTADAVPDSPNVPPATTASTSDSWGPIRVERMTRIRKTIAEHTHDSWLTVPRVTNFDDADVTELEKIRQASKADYAARGIKLTSMAFVIKAVALALRNNPVLNASIDEDNEQIVYKQYINVGIAVDTERGLVVPSLRRPDELRIPDIARNLSNMADNARNNNFKLEDLRGSTFTISNLGAVGGTYSTPIINLPEVAILLLGRSRRMPCVMDDNRISPRLMMPLSLSYDHRIVDGAAAARFLNGVIEYLENPSRLLIAP